MTIPIRPAIKRGLLIFLFLLAATVLTACYMPVQPVIKLSPAIKPDHMVLQTGESKSATLQIEDKRPLNAYGSAKIDPEQNPAQIFKIYLAQGLNKQGISIVNASSRNPPANHITLQILKLDYRTLSGYVSSNIQTFASVSVIVKNNRRTYTKTYYASSYNDNYLTAAKQTSSEQMSAAVNKLLNAIINDSELIKFLNT